MLVFHIVSMSIYLQVLKSLGTESNRPSCAAQCVAFIAVIELPLGCWPDVIGVLCSNILDEGSSDTMKEASLEAIGYICQDIVSVHFHFDFITFVGRVISINYFQDHDCLIPHSNNILTAIVHGMRKDVTNNHVRMAATTALLNSLEFTKANFEKEVSFVILFFLYHDLS